MALGAIESVCEDELISRDGHQVQVFANWDDRLTQLHKVTASEMEVRNQLAAF